MSDDHSNDEIAALKARLAHLEQERLAGTKPVPVAATPASGFQSGFNGCFGVAAAVVLCIVFLAMCGIMAGGDDKTTASSSTSPGSASTASAPAAPVARWSYNDTTDPMTSKTSHLACINSSTEVRLDFPYKTQNPVLCVRKDPRHGTDAFIQLPEGGQFMCTSYDGCTVQIRFDEGAAQAFTAVEPDDGSSNTLFIRNATRFIAGLERAKVVRVAANFYQNGTQTMTYDGEGFDRAKVGLSATAKK